MATKSKSNTSLQNFPTKLQQQQQNGPPIPERSDCFHMLQENFKHDLHGKARNMFGNQHDDKEILVILDAIDTITDKLQREHGAIVVQFELWKLLDIQGIPISKVNAHQDNYLLSAES